MCLGDWQLCWAHRSLVSPLEKRYRGHEEAKVSADRADGRVTHCARQTPRPKKCNQGLRERAGLLQWENTGHKVAVKMRPDDAGLRGDPSNIPAEDPDCPELPLCPETPGLWVGTCQNAHI